MADYLCKILRKEKFYKVKTDYLARTSKMDPNTSNWSPHESFN